MATRRMAFHLAGILWLVLGILAILTVFGTLAGLALAWFVGIRRSAVAARLGAAIGLMLLAPLQLVIDAMGCRRDACGIGPYLLADGLPLALAAINLYAGWPDRSRGSGPQAIGVPANGIALAQAASEAWVEAPGQQRLWDADLLESVSRPTRTLEAAPTEPLVELATREVVPPSQAIWSEALPMTGLTRTAPAP